MESLPPLKALRAFEAAARFESFNRAAEALSVTPSAVSHQVKLLEEFLGVPLFERRNRQVRLTRAGRAYLPPVRDAFEQIRIATGQARKRDASGALTVSSAPSFAVGWLMPRLAAFQLAHPDIEVRLTSSIELVDFATSDVDVGIRSGAGTWPDLESHRLIADEVVPVCSPSLLAGGGALHTPADLRDATLLHELARLGQWRSWFAAVGVDDVDTERGPKFQSAAMTVEAAIAGLGVAIANRRLVESHLESGRLVVPFDCDLPTASAYYLVYPKSRASDPRVDAFARWIVAAAAEVPAPEAANG